MNSYINMTSAIIKVYICKLCEIRKDNTTTSAYDRGCIVKNFDLGFEEHYQKKKKKVRNSYFK